MVSAEIRKRLLVLEASRWIGVSEVGGQNKGQLVEMFQKSADDKASKEPWCLAFVLFCVKYVDLIANEVMQASTFGHKLFVTEHCMTMWNESPRECRLDQPEVGALIFWQYWKDEKPTASGHVGIIKKILDEDHILTVEGNTSAPSDEVVREGDGVFVKRRRIKANNGTMRVKGFLSPW
jgi:hypothetical protein